ncbi:hypothetical protein PENSPDRAFT_759158 [Peniophora sp. CONT]|nr:hypothetical protein PENSPDRAFT_759158 [Peniophora sp. CONT]
MPHLSTVVLNDCFTILPSSIYAASLRRLELYDVHGWNDVDGMIQCLQNMPVLEHLVFENYETSENAPFDATRSRAHPPRCVRLDYLVKLELISVFNWNVAIFGYLTIPSSATIKTFHHVTINDDRRVPDDHLAMLADALVEHFAPASRAGAHFNEVVIDNISVEGGLASSGEGHNPHLPDYFCFALPTSINTSEALVLDFLDKFFTIPVIRQADKVRFTGDFLEWYPTYIPRYQSIFPAANLDSTVVS